MNLSIGFLTFFGLLPSNLGNPKNIWIYLGFLIIAVEMFSTLHFGIFRSFAGTRRVIETVTFASTLAVHFISLVEVRIYKNRELSFRKEEKAFPHWILSYVLITETIKLAMDWDDVSSQIENITSLVSTCFIKMRCLTHAYYTSIIQGKLESIKGRLVSQNAQEFSNTKANYNITLDMLVNLQGFYSASLVFMYIHICFNITAEVYWIYVLCLNEMYVDILKSMVFIIDALIVLYLPLQFCDFVLSKVREIGLIVGNYSSEGRSGFSNFALRMMNTPFRFELFGFLEMNLDFMKEVSSYS